MAAVPRRVCGYSPFPCTVQSGRQETWEILADRNLIRKPRGQKREDGSRLVELSDQHSAAKRQSPSAFGRFLKSTFFLFVFPSARLLPLHPSSLSLAPLMPCVCARTGCDGGIDVKRGHVHMDIVTESCLTKLSTSTVKSKEHFFTRSIARSGPNLVPSLSL